MPLRTRIGALLDLRLRRASVVLILAFIVLAASWHWQDLIPDYFVFGDDLAYIAEARSPGGFWDHLLIPHNAHVVPLFRLWTYGLMRHAGSLGKLPPILGAACCVSLMAATAIVGLLIFKATRNAALSLSVIAGLGLSSVVAPALTWYSASQALWAGTAIVLELLLVHDWYHRGGPARLIAALGLILIAPAIWMGGLVAGPCAAAYVWTRATRRARMGAIGCLAAGSATAGLFLALSLGRVPLSSLTPTRPDAKAFRPAIVQGAVSTAQAISEVLVLGNLGLEARSSPFQGIVLTSLLVALWGFSRGGFTPLEPLEAAGAMMVLSSYLMAYTFRGNYPFEQLRTVTWYHLIPELGWCLLLAGWFARIATLRSEAPGLPLRVRGALTVVGVMVVAMILHREPIARLLLGTAPPVAPFEEKAFRVEPRAARHRALVLAAWRCDRQAQWLNRLDLIERIAQRAGLGKSSLRGAFSRVLIPGIPVNQGQPDVADLLDLPEAGPPIPPGQLRRSLAPLFEAIPEHRPPWIGSAAPWPWYPPPEPDS